VFNVAVMGYTNSTESYSDYSDYGNNTEYCFDGSNNTDSVGHPMSPSSSVAFGMVTTALTSVMWNLISRSLILSAMTPSSTMAISTPIQFAASLFSLTADVDGNRYSLSPFSKVPPTTSIILKSYSYFNRDIIGQLSILHGNGCYPLYSLTEVDNYLYDPGGSSCDKLSLRLVGIVRMNDDLEQAELAERSLQIVTANIVI
jgi:hypothetical protein